MKNPNYAQQFLIAVLVLFRYDLLRYLSKVRIYRAIRSRFRGKITWMRFESIFDPQHEFNQPDQHNQCETVY